MFRTILSTLCLLALTGLARAEEKKDAPNAVRGKFKSWQDNTLTVTDKAGKDVTFNVPGDTRVDEMVGTEKKSFLAKNTFRELNRDCDVVITLDGEKRVTNILVDRGNIIKGHFKGYRNGQLTIMTGKKGEEKERTFNVPPDTKIDEYVANEKKSFLAKNTFQELNDNSEVIVTLSHDGKAVENITVNRRK
jgi:hypothetical protein